MTHVRETTDIEVCTDCAECVANAEGPAGHGDLIAAQWEGYSLHLVGDGEPSFSWSQCDGCGSWLGGDRHAATAWDERPHAIGCTCDDCAFWADGNVAP